MAQTRVECRILAIVPKIVMFLSSLGLATMKVLIVIGFLISTQVTWGQEFFDGAKYSLVDIFCTAVSEKESYPEKFTDMEKIWGLLEKSLQEGELFSVLSGADQKDLDFQKIKSTSIFKNCIELNRKEFELAEFILSGQKIVRESLKAYRLNQPVQVATISVPLSGGGEASEMAVELSSANSKIENVKVVESVINREKKYTEMWKQFIQGLKSKVKPLAFWLKKPNKIR